MGAAGYDKISGGIEFHSRGEATKKECLKALIDEDTRFRVKGCDLVGNLLKWEKSIAVVLE